MILFGACIRPKVYLHVELITDTYIKGLRNVWLSFVLRLGVSKWKLLVL